MLVSLFIRRKPCSVFPELMSTDNHHTRGKAGTLYIDKRFFKPVSRKGHEWIQSHPVQARAMGLLCEIGQWNSPPKDAVTDNLKNQILDEINKIKNKASSQKIPSHRA